MSTSHRSAGNARFAEEGRRMRPASMSFSVMRWVRIAPAGGSGSRTGAAGADDVSDLSTAWEFRGNDWRDSGPGEELAAGSRAPVMPWRWYSPWSRWRLAKGIG